MQAVRSKPLTRRAAPKRGIDPAERRRALDGGQSDGLGCLAAVCERQPRGQLTGRLLWRLAVEGHHGGRHASGPAELRAPAIGDRRYLDLVRTPADSFFEMMNGHLGDAGREVRSAGDFTRLSRAIKRNRSRRRRPQPPVRTIIQRSGQRKICGVRLSTRFALTMHRLCTEGIQKNTRGGSLQKVKCEFGPE
jgi:hypothetical protein